MEKVCSLHFLPNRTFVIYVSVFSHELHNLTLRPLISMQMVREMDVILRHEIAQPAKSCESKDGVSFLDQVIFPLYEVMAAVCFLSHLKLLKKE